MNDGISAVKVIKIGVAVVAGLFLLITGCEGMQTVKTGYRGIRVTFGHVDPHPLTEGLYLVNPFTTHVAQLNIQTLKWESHTEAYTKDVQKATIHFAVNYSLDPSYAAEMYRTVGEDWPSALMPQVVNEEIKRQIGQVEAVGLVAQRDAVAREIEKLITVNLGAKHILMSGFRLTNLDYTHEFESAVEAKVVAQQRAIEEQNRTVQIQQQANQTVITAKAAAESMTIRANALASNPKLVEWEAVQKWNGVLPVYVLSGAVPFIGMQGGK